MDLDQENLNLIEVIELTEEINYDDLVIEEEGLENECEEDNEYEALEFFGVKFIKQNITGKTTDLKNLMLQIKSVQSEHEHMMLLFSEFVEDNTVVKGSHATMQRKEILWSIVNELDKAFDLPDPKMHDFFKNAKEINESGFIKMFESYEIGIKCLNRILHQDIYKTEPQSKIGRRKKIYLILK
jgi:hypothetical protein